MHNMKGSAFHPAWLDWPNFKQLVFTILVMVFQQLCMCIVQARISLFVFFYSVPHIY